MSPSKALASPNYSLKAVTAVLAQAVAQAAVAVSVPVALSTSVAVLLLPSKAPYLSKIIAPSAVPAVHPPPLLPQVLAVAVAVWAVITLMVLTAPQGLAPQAVPAVMPLTSNKAAQAVSYQAAQTKPKPTVIEASSSMTTVKAAAVALLQAPDQIVPAQVTVAQVKPSAAVAVAQVPLALLPQEELVVTADSAVAAVAAVVAQLPVAPVAPAVLAPVASVAQVP